MSVQEQGLAIAGDDSPWALKLAAANFALLRRPYWSDTTPRGAWSARKLTILCDCPTTTNEYYWRNPSTGARGWMCGKCMGITQTG